MTGSVCGSRHLGSYSSQTLNVMTRMSPGYGSGPSGYDSVQESMLPYFKTFDDFRIEIEEVVYADEKQVIT